ncbi:MULTISPECIES: VOC family protein [unclassified Sinorhizobium]|uniref:VOC family protein n=1 Tax=unclassified Sinorhizobium TaxID=2613772 RepID=UPI0024C29BF8|nr:MULTISPECIES: VOC family protein [unclassified Sinorhizobium]MDK1375358.1 VOC family protein [Sinorhizobium sp. 6-70]MDK1477974.1 VOC family protein [Sinorhizobium sp. 6-117]
MIGYTMVGTTDLRRAERFYDPLMALIGQERCYCDEQVSSWGRRDDGRAPRFFACYPFDGNRASIGNGTMTAFLVESADVIERMFEIALERGGRSEGTPGFRPQYGDGFYAAYVRDPDGNKLAFVCYDAKKALTPDA